GTPREAFHPKSDEAKDALNQTSTMDYDALASWFVKRGYVVVVPRRRGYGLSTGEFAEASHRGSDASYLHAGREAAKDIRATVEAFRSKDFVDGNRVLLAGQSAGGFS